MYVPRLRILIDPIYVQVANLSGSSTYYKYVSLVRELTARGHFVYWCIPDAEYVPNDIENDPRVGIIRTTAAQDQFIVDGLITDKFFNLFNRIAGTFHVDVLCTSRNSLALTYKRLLEAPRYFDSDEKYTDKSYGLPVVLIEEFPQTKKRQHSAYAYFLSQCLGYISSDRTIFLSNHNREEIVAEMRETIVNSKIQRWIENTRIIPAGIETKQLDQIYEPNRWTVEKGFQVLSIGRIFGPTYVEFLPWFDYLFKSGMSDVCLTISLSGALSGPMKAKLTKIGFDFTNVGRQFKIIENNPRSNFLRMLRKYHAFVAPVSHLDHPTGIFEAMYMGVPGVIPVSDYQQTFFKDYPFIIDPTKPEELISQLKWIRANKAEAREMVLPWRDIIKEKYDATDNIRKLADEIEAAARNKLDKFQTSQGVVNIMKELKGKVYTMGDVIEFLRKAGWMGVSIGNMKVRSTFTYSISAIHHAMRLNGFVDTCDRPTPYFVRKDIFERDYLQTSANGSSVSEGNRKDTYAHKTKIKSKILSKLSDVETKKPLLQIKPRTRRSTA